MIPRLFRPGRLMRRIGRLTDVAVAIAAIFGGGFGAYHLINQPGNDCGQGGTVTNVVDGDTIDVGGCRVRLYAVDTPETQWRQRGTPWCAAYDAGKAAKDAVTVLTLGQPVTFGHREGDSSGRDMAAEVYLPDGTELGAWLIANGHAVARPDLTDAGRHLPDPAITDACPPGVPGGQAANR